MPFPKIGLEAILDMSKFNKGLKGYDKGTAKINKQNTSMTKSIAKFATSLTIGFAAVAGAAVTLNKALEFGKRGAIVTQTTESFEGLIDKVGASRDTLQLLRTATGGTVDDMTLMSSTTTLLAGAQDDLARAMAGAAPELAEIAKAANKLNPSLGDTAFLYQSLGTGIKRSSPLILDNLGLVIKVGEANERYAEKLGKTVEQLSASDKQHALLEDTLRAGNVLIEQAGGSTDSAADGFARLGASVKNLTDHLATEAAPGLSRFADVLDRSIVLIFDAADALDRLQETMLLGTDAYDAYVDGVVDAAVAHGSLSKEQGEGVKEQAKFGEVTEETQKAIGFTLRSTNALIKTLKVLSREEFDAERATARLKKMVNSTTESMKTLAAKQRTLTRALHEGALTAEEEEEALKALRKAAENVRDSFESFYSTLAGGIVGLRDLDVAAVQSAKDYKKALKDLAKSAGKSYKSIRDDYEDSLPDSTSVEQRMDMAADAWDEFGLRAEDVIQRGAESPWWGQLEQELMAVGETRPPDVGIQEWMAGVKQAFYDGDLPGLINEDAAAWQAHSAAVKAAQQEEAAAVRQANAEKRAAIEAAREAQLAAEKEARERATVELALSLAEQTGQLQAWSAQKFGPDFAQVGDSAEEVMALLDAGMLEIDTGLGNLITNTAGGIADALDLTGQQAEDTKAQFETLLDPETFEQQADAMATIIEQMGEGIPEAIEIEEDPFLPLSTNFQGAAEAIVTGAGDMDTAMVTAFTNIDTASGTAADAVLQQWLTGSVIPEMIEGMDGMTVAWVEDIDEVEREWTAAADSMARTLSRFLSDATDDWSDMAKHAIADIQLVMDELNEIPRNITTTVTVVYGGTQTTDEPTEPPPPPTPPPPGAGTTSVGFGFGPGGTMPSSVPVMPSAAAAGFLPPPIHVTIGPNTISNGMDQAVFEASVTQVIMSAVRGA